MIREVITDNGKKLFENKKDKDGDSESAFEKLLEENKIRHMLARMKHPQTNGKIQKCFHK